MKVQWNKFISLNSAAVVGFFLFYLFVFYTFIQKRVHNLAPFMATLLLGNLYTTFGM